MTTRISSPVAYAISANARAASPDASLRSMRSITWLRRDPMVRKVRKCADATEVTYAERAIKFCCDPSTCRKACFLDLLFPMISISYLVIACAGDTLPRTPSTLSIDCSNLAISSSEHCCYSRRKHCSLECRRDLRFLVRYVQIVFDSVSLSYGSYTSKMNLDLFGHAANIGSHWIARVHGFCQLVGVDQIQQKPARTIFHYTRHDFIQCGARIVRFETRVNRSLHTLGQRVQQILKAFPTPKRRMSATRSTRTLQCPRTIARRTRQSIRVVASRRRRIANATSIRSPQP